MAYMNREFFIRLNGVIEVDEAYSRLGRGLKARSSSSLGHRARGKENKHYRGAEKS